MRRFGLHLVVLWICIISFAGLCFGQVTGQPTTSPTPNEQVTLRSEMSLRDRDKLNELVGKLVNDLGASLAGASILLGDRLGLYQAMADGETTTSAELAKNKPLTKVMPLNATLVVNRTCHISNASPGARTRRTVIKTQDMAGDRT